MSALPASRPRARRARRPSHAAVATLAAAVLGACYTYAPPPQAAGAGVVPRTLPADALVRLTLTDAGAVALASQVGPRVEVIDGRVQRADADSIVVSVSQTVDRQGVEHDWAGERVALARTAVDAVGVRRLDRGRTALALAGAAALLVGTFVGFAQGEAGGGPGSRPLPSPR